MVNNPEDADLNLVFDSYDNRMLRELPWRLLFSPRTVMYSEGDEGIPVLPGLYVSLTKKHFQKGRTGSHGYLRYLAENGGNRLCKGHERREKRHLFCFTGRRSHPVRDQLFALFKDHPDSLVEDTSKAYDHWSGQRPEEMQSQYVEQIRQAHFSICPRGKGANCIRLFESMRLGVAPVLVSDDWVLPDGPDWDAFLIRVPEAKLADLPAILEERRHRAEEMGLLARKAYENHFSAASMPQRILEQLESIALDNRSDRIERLSLWIQFHTVTMYWFFHFKALNIRKWIQLNRGGLSNDN